ncbi:exodeoxyribonuclease VII small subunit [Chlamydia abortus]|jgi:exodeoxyribonuclease VII small subunit|uniref:Exodeoxyribonuclease 7 small subunit n=1 Tax=Paenibacillus residui TaxID=629724 RepID=A0ABW3DF81_9BACL|nr:MULTISPECIES: exodeoxyribonuclease VII small subunit [Paenibacillaceae]SHE11142.1 exodeoxyribonuclease VII small subunit [Chlamydia abortus]
MTTDKTELSFEQAMDKLEEIVTQLENGDVPLEKAIGLFQEGMEMSRMCSQKLDQIERKIEMLVEENGTIGKKPFLAEMDEGESV